MWRKVRKLLFMTIVWAVIIGVVGTCLAWLVLSGFWVMLVFMALCGGAWEAWRTRDVNSNDEA